MSLLGWFHTGVSILPIGFGLVAFIRDRKIDPANRIGMLYLVTMLIGTVSAFGFIFARGFTPAQVLTVITLALLLIGAFTVRGQRRGPGLVQNICLTGSYILLMVFTTTEALVHFPRGHPFASGPTDSALIPVRAALLVAFVLGLGYQIFEQRAASRR
jgi:hypothetical protein